MPKLTDLVTALSTNVVARLAAAGYPALSEGKILLGRQRQHEHIAPPRILLVPMGSKFGPVDNYSRAPVGSAEARAQMQQKSIATEFVTFEVRCWGASTADPDEQRDDDFDVTQALYHAVSQSARDTFGPFTAGGVELEDGDWSDATFAGAQHLSYGREFVFGLVVPTPVLDHLFPYAPSDVKANPKTFLTTPDGTSSQGCGA